MTTTGDPDIATRLAYLEGRMDEQTALLRQMVGQIEQLNAQVVQVNGRIDRLYLTTFGIGGGIIAGLVGVILTLVLQG